LFALEDLKGQGGDGENVVEIVRGVEAGGGHVGFCEEGGLADEGILWMFRNKGRVERGVDARFGGNGDGVGSAELEGWAVGD